MQRPGWNEPGRVLLERVGDSCKEILERLDQFFLGYLKPFGRLFFGDLGWLSTINPQESPMKMDSNPWEDD